MANIEVNNSGWNSIGDQKGGMGTLGGILSMIPMTSAVGNVMTTLDSARNGGAKGGIISGVVKGLTKTKAPVGDGFGKELSEAQGMFGSDKMNVGGLRTAGDLPKLGGG